jgi:TolB protein
MVSRFLLVGVLGSLAFAVFAAGATSSGNAVPRRNGELVFSSLQVRKGDYELYLMRADGTRKRRITHRRAFERYPRWSPDGKWLAYISNRSQPSTERAYEIYVMRPNGSGFRRVTHDRWIDDQLAWSPDGRRIAFESNRQSGKFGLWVMNVNGTGARRLTSDGGIPAWSPDGETIAFVRSNTKGGPYGTDEIWVMDQDGTNERRLTVPPVGDTSSGHDSMPEWSPDGNQIAFARSFRGRQDIYTIRADGTGLRRLTKDSGRFSWPTWSPDGRRIAYVRHHSKKVDVNVMNADGTQQKRLTVGGLDYAYLDWQPLP